MLSLEWLAVSGIVSIAFLFVLLRSYSVWFAILAPATIAVLSARIETRNAEFVLVAAGLGLFWLGLIAIRAMLLRSVSLQLLAKYEQQIDSLDVEASIDARLNDGEAHRLIRQTESGVSLTRTGKFFARLTSVFYRLTYQPRI